MAAELGRYLNIDESTFSNSSKEISTPSNTSQEISTSNEALAAPSVHEQALSAILEVVTSNSDATQQFVRTPAPQGGVQEWWARMISGSFNNSSSTTSCPAIGESL
jgi:hypothetical protein